MADASGSSHYWAIAQEEIFGTTPSPFNPQQYRFLEGSDAVDNRSTLTSSELTSDRQLRSSTLGTPQPDFSPSFELSAQSFDMLVEGALQGSWVGNGYASLTVDITGGDGTITTDGGEFWSTYNFADGDVITITGLSTNTDGSFLIASGSGTATITVTDLSGGAVTFSAEADVAVVVIAGRSSAVIDSSANNITVDATARTITAASAIWTSASPDLRYGDLIYLNGFSNAGNNGYFKVLSATATVLTLTTDATTLVNETLSTGDLEVANNTAFVVAGSTKHSYSIESGYTDVNLYRTLRGAQISDMSMSYGTDSIITGDMTFMGLSLSAFDVASEATSVSNPTTTPVFNTFRGFVTFDGSAPNCVTDLSWSLSNSSEGLQCVFSDSLSSITHGKSLVTGSLTSYLSDAGLSTKYSDETNIAVYIVAEDADGRTFGVGMDNVQLQGEAIQVNETTVEISFDFAALYSDDEHMNIYIIESRPLPA